MVAGTTSGGAGPVTGAAGRVRGLTQRRTGSLKLELLSLGWCFSHIWPHAKSNP